MGILFLGAMVLPITVGLFWYRLPRDGKLSELDEVLAHQSIAASST